MVVREGGVVVLVLFGTPRQALSCRLATTAAQHCTPWLQELASSTVSMLERLGVSNQLHAATMIKFSGEGPSTIAVCLTGTLTSLDL